MQADLNNPNLHIVAGDVCDEIVRGKAIDLAVNKCGSLDILVNNAAIFLLSGVDATREQWQRTFEVNLLAGANLVSQSLVQLRKSPNPAIVNIASISAHRAQTGRWTYNAMKGALLELTKCQALDLSKDRIRVKGGMRQLDTLVTSRRPPLSDLLAIGVSKFLTGPFKCAPGRIIEPILAQRADDSRLVVPLQAYLRSGDHPQTIIRERAIADHVAEHHHPPHAQLRHLREHRLQCGSVSMDVREDGDHDSVFFAESFPVSGLRPTLSSSKARS